MHGRSLLRYNNVRPVYGWKWLGHQLYANSVVPRRASEHFCESLHSHILYSIILYIYIYIYTLKSEKSGLLEILSKSSDAL